MRKMTNNMTEWRKSAITFDNVGWAYIALLQIATFKVQTISSLTVYRVTIQLVANLPLTSKQKFHFGLACPSLARPKWNFCFEVNGRFATS